MRNTPHRAARRSAKGQAMAIFALVSVLLFVVAGLAVDAGTSYLTSNQIERAAASAALAGVAYLPGDLPDAQNAALVEAARDGFPNAGTGNACPGSPTPSPCVVTSQPVVGGVVQDNKLTVTISASVSTVFLRIVGFGAHTVVRSETAEYLPPIAIGQPGSQQGSEMTSPCDGGSSSPGTYCGSPAAGLGSGGSNFYFEREEGWGNPRSEGDPFTPSPQQGGNGCGPGGGSACDASANPDYHAISPEAGTENCCDATLNWNGGSNYLITIPNNQSADVQIYNPAFAPDTCGDGSTSVYCYHENDGSFSGSGAPATSYSAMEYTIFQVSTLSSRSGDTKISQEVFYPYNATGLASAPSGSCSGTKPYSFFYFNPPTSGSPTQTQQCVNTTTKPFPATYHEWVSALQYSPTQTYDQTLYNHPLNNTINPGGYISNTSGKTEYFRLEVDTLTYNGNTTCAPPGPCSYISTGTSAASEAHKGYAVRLVSDAGSPAAPQGTVSGTQCNSTCGTMSAMDDMTIYTPINGATQTQFTIPLFNVDPSYAGQTINVDLFDIGDVGGGAAYVAIQAPGQAAGSFATVASGSTMTDLGDSQTSGGTNTVSEGWSTGQPSTCACFQTAASGGGAAIYNGQWVQIPIVVPSGLPAGYWNLVYSVTPGTVAGDTFGVQVGFNGTPDHLLP
jgi:Flp pilus assembly protein TadG